jgi:hypothetical protein
LCNNHVDHTCSNGLLMDSIVYLTKAVASTAKEFVRIREIGFIYQPDLGPSEPECASNASKIESKAAFVKQNMSVIGDF